MGSLETIHVLVVVSVVIDVDVPSGGDGTLLGLVWWQRIIKQCPKHRGS